MTVKKTAVLNFDTNDRDSLMNAYKVINNIVYRMENDDDRDYTQITVPHQCTIDIDELRTTQFVLDKLSDFLISWELE